MGAGLILARTRGGPRVEYVNLENYASRMVELNGDSHGLKPHRLKAERDRLAHEMHRILKPSIRRLTTRKNMTRDLQDDIDQHTFIAICRALTDWNPDIATFSTHVHWKVRAELQTLQHFEFPDRRRLATPQRISFLELDRPYTGDDGSTYTMADYLVDETAEDLVESEAKRHVALHTFERVFSHAIARQMQAYCINQTDQDKISARRHSLMRNRWIYIRRTLGQETYEQIAQEYSVTRERARQIIITVDREARGQLPRFCKEENRVVPATRMPPEDVHPSWDYMLIDFYMATGEDTRLFGRGTKMPTRTESYDFRPEVHVAPQDVTEMLAEIARPAEVAPEVRSEDPQVVPAEIRDNVVRMPDRRKGLMRQAAITAIAGAMLTTAVAANAQSRAIPPEAPVAHPAQSVAEAGPAPTRSVRTEAVRTRTEPSRRTLIAIESITVNQPSWGVRIADYATAQQAKAGWATEPRSWGWLRGLRAAYIAPASGGTHGVAFGPLSEPQAQGMCHEAKRHSKPCQIVRFGVQRQASRGGKEPRA
jgi:hypothetical protein